MRLDFSVPIQTIVNVLDKVIVEDYKVKLSVLLTGVSAYTSTPLNLFIKGVSGSGKSYNATRVLRLFPKSDVWRIGKLSPSALIHLKGEAYTNTGVKVKDLEKPDKKTDPEGYRKYLDLVSDVHYELDLHGKILLFLDAPMPETFHMLYPILSHDEEEIDYKITDKNRFGQLQTKHVIIKGWPATIFIRAKEEVVPEEFRTRCFTVCPDENKNKIKAVNRLTHMFNAYPWLKDDVNLDVEAVKVWIQNLKEELKNYSDIILPFEDLDGFHPSEVASDMREFNHLETFIKCLAALNCFNRPALTLDKNKYLLASEDDVKDAWTLFLELFETSRTGLSEHLLKFYHDVLEQQECFTTSEALALYNANFKPKRSRKTVERYLKILEEQNYLSSEEDSADKRRIIYKPILGRNNGEKWTIMDKQQMSTILSSDLKNNFEKWRKNMDTPTASHIDNSRMVKPVFWMKNEILTMDKLEDYILSKADGLSIFQLKFLKPKTEKEREIMDNWKMSTIVHNSGENKPFTSLFVIDGKLCPTEKCSLCGKQPVYAQINYADGSWGLLCEECYHKKLKQTEETENGDM